MWWHYTYQIQFNYDIVDICLVELIKIFKNFLGKNFDMKIRLRN